MDQGGAALDAPPILPEADYIDIVATRTEGAAASWLSHEQLAIEAGRRAPWASWRAFREEMIRAFEPTTDESLARQQLAVLKQTGRIAGYIQKFREVRGRIQDMSVPDEFAAFMRGLQPRIRNQVGPMVEDDLAEAMRMAARIELWSQTESSGSGSGGQKDQGGRGGSGKKMGGQGPTKGNVHVVESSVAAVDKGRQGQRGKGQQTGGQQGQRKNKPPCFACGKPHYLRECPEYKAAQEVLKKKKSGN